MKTNLLILILLTFISPFSWAQNSRENAISLVKQNQNDLVELDKSQAKLLELSQQKKYLLAAFTDELNKNLRQLEAIANYPEHVKIQINAMAAKMAQMNKQFLALQEATQNENRKFQTLSNASKARHDIALNAIRNMK